MKNANRKITLVIISGMVIVLFLSGFSMGKEMTKVDVKTSAGIASPILKVDNGETLTIGNSEGNGTYEFTVKNYDEQGNINQVDLEYYIEILTDINKNISFKIYKENNELEIQESKTENFLMGKNKKQEDKYRIEIICDEERSLSELIQDIQIKVHSEQKKA